MSGCSECYYNSLKLSLNSFINKSNIIHNNKYIYDNVIYIDNKTKVDIICKNHGIFKQLPSTHLSGSGCKECMKINFSHTNEDFIKMSKKLYNDKFLYVKCKYSGICNKVTLYCIKHGYFEINSDYHLRKNGACKKCNQKHYISENDWLDSLFIPKENRQIKIGKYTVDGINYKYNL
jgi:hypothetical protein